MTLNAGSSSVKFALFDASLEVLLRGQIDGIGGMAELKISEAKFDNPFAGSEPPDADHEDIAPWLIDRLATRGDDLALRAVGHRVVHGGRDFADPVLIDEAVLEALRALVSLAPLHQPHNLAAIEIIRDRRPDLPQIACFDTAFHRSQPRLAQLFGLPREFADKGLLRYGFHGLSYDYISSVLPEYLDGRPGDRVVVAHLGHGASMCAIENGRSVATTMGFTALEGLPMGTRCGAIDPGVILYLLTQEKMSVSHVEDLLYRRSGLLGLSGISGDMRDLLASDDPAAAEAVDFFVYRIARELGSLAAALGGLDALVFTGGIGENAAEIRARVCAAAAWLGVALDRAANERHGPLISPSEARPSLWVIPTDEERVIARHVAGLLRQQ